LSVILRSSIIGGKAVPSSVWFKIVIKAPDNKTANSGMFFFQLNVSVFDIIYLPSCLLRIFIAKSTLQQHIIHFTRTQFMRIGLIEFFHLPSFTLHIYNSFIMKTENLTNL